MIKLKYVFSEWFNTPPPAGYCCYIMSNVIESKDTVFFKVGDEYFMEKEDFGVNGQDEYWEIERLIQCHYCMKEYDVQ